jgi:hypothetical protein
MKEKRAAEAAKARVKYTAEEIAKKEKADEDSGSHSGADGKDGDSKDDGGEKEGGTGKDDNGHGHGHVDDVEDGKKASQDRKELPGHGHGHGHLDHNNHEEGEDLHEVDIHEGHDHAAGAVPIGKQIMLKRGDGKVLTDAEAVRWKLISEVFASADEDGDGSLSVEVRSDKPFFVVLVCHISSQTQKDCYTEHGDRS